MNTWLFGRGLSVRKLTQASKTVKKVRRKKSVSSLVSQSMRLGKKITVGAVKLAALIFIGRL
jgi:hypothetical protein